MSQQCNTVDDKDNKSTHGDTCKMKKTNAQKAINENSNKKEKELTKKGSGIIYLLSYLFLYVHRKKIL